MLQSWPKLQSCLALQPASADGTWEDRISLWSCGTRPRRYLQEEGRYLQMVWAPCMSSVNHCVKQQYMRTLRAGIMYVKVSTYIVHFCAIDGEMLPIWKVRHCFTALTSRAGGRLRRDDDERRRAATAMTAASSIVSTYM